MQPVEVGDAVVVAIGTGHEGHDGERAEIHEQIAEEIEQDSCEAVLPTCDHTDEDVARLRDA